jgi:hypothetical protein
MDPLLPPAVTRGSQRPSDARRFAPVSGELPARVRVAAWYFEATGALTLVSVAMAAIAAPLHLGLFAGVRVGFVSGLLRAAAGVGWLWGGRSLAAGERRGAVVAGLTLVAPLIARAAGQAVPTSVLVLGAVGALAVFSAWGDLRPGGWHDDA